MDASTRYYFEQELSKLESKYLNESFEIRYRLKAEDGSDSEVKQEVEEILDKLGTDEVLKIKNIQLEFEAIDGDNFIGPLPTEELEAFRELVKSAFKAGYGSVEEYLFSLEKVGAVQGEINDNPFELTLDLSDISDNLAELESSYSTLYSAQKELNDTGEITASTLQKLTENDLLQYLEVVDGQLRVSTQALENQAEAAKNFSNRRTKACNGQ